MHRIWCISQVTKEDAPPRFNENANDGPLNDSYQRGWVQNKAWCSWGSVFFGPANWDLKGFLMDFWGFAGN